jgi:hypothetical protein
MGITLGGWGLGANNRISIETRFRKGGQELKKEFTTGCTSLRKSLKSAIFRFN